MIVELWMWIMVLESNVEVKVMIIYSIANFIVCMMYSSVYGLISESS